MDGPLSVDVGAFARQREGERVRGSTRGVFESRLDLVVSVIRSERFGLASRDDDSRDRVMCTKRNERWKDSERVVAGRDGERTEGRRDWREEKEKVTAGSYIQLY